MKRRGIAALVIVARSCSRWRAASSARSIFFASGASQARLTTSIDSLQHVVDSLKQYADKVQHDPATQERIAREVFGMVRGNKELLYRFTTPADSAGRKP